MEIYTKKKPLSRILIYFIMILFAMGLVMNGLFCSNNNLFDLDKSTVIEMWSISESIVPYDSGDDTPCFRTSFLSKNNSRTETVTKNICPIPAIAAIPKGFSLFYFLIIVFLFYFSALFIFLPDEWTLINQKVRLDD